MKQCQVRDPTTSKPSKLGVGKYVSVLNDDDEWEPPFLSKPVPILVDDPEVVIAFSDHYVMDELGRIDPAATEENTRRWHRDVLSPEPHRPFWRCLVEMSIPAAQASVTSGARSIGRPSQSRSAQPATCGPAIWRAELEKVATII